MSDLLTGTPLSSTQYVSTTTDYPKWMQDAIYKQIQSAQNVANMPYQQYNLPTVAELSPLQQQAYQGVQANQGSWQPELNMASSGMQAFAGKGTADQLRSEQNQYLRQGLVDQNLNAGQGYWGQAGQLNAVGAASPYLQSAAGTDIYGAAQPYMSQAGQTTAQALSDRALNAASPYLQSAAQTSAQNIGQYMSPYQQNVMDVIAEQGTRNLTENLMPGVSDAFIKAGQFGSSRMGEFGSRAVRDTQEAILNQQAQLANQGYGQALSAAQADLARQAQLAGTVGSISGADLSRVLQGGAQYGNLAQTQGQLASQQAANQLAVGQQYGNLTSQQMQNLANLGQMQTAAGQTQQQYGLTAAQAAQQAQADDYVRQMQALMNTAALAQQRQTQGYADTAALEAAGTAQQQQAQQQLTAAYDQFKEQRDYPQTQLDWLSAQVRGLTPYTATGTSGTTSATGAAYSPSVLAQLGSAYSAYRGLTS